MKNYTTEINNTKYLVKQDEGIVLNLANNQLISFEDFTRMLKKKNNEFSNEWLNLPIEDTLDYYLDKTNVITAFSFESDYNDKEGDLIRTSYDIVIGIDNEEPYIVRDIISKSNVSKGEELPISNDNTGVEGYLTLKTGLDNSILWYARQQGDDVLAEVTEALGFEDLHDCYIHKTDTQLIIKKALIEDIVLWFERIVYTEQGQNKVKTRKSRF